MPMLPAEVQALFTHDDGTYLFARWGRPMVPVVFGVEQETLVALRGAMEQVATLAGTLLGEVDPDTGANLMMFFVRDWAELPMIPGLDGLVPGLADVVGKLTAQDANQYRLFRFDPDGAIRAAFVFLRVDAGPGGLGGLPVQALALDQAVRVILLWAPQAFRGRAALDDHNGLAVLRPDVAALIRAAYSPVLPRCTGDPSHAFRLAART